MIQWDSKYELGISSIDNQHKELVRLISKMSDLVTNAAEGDDVYDEMVGIIHELTDYTVYHFKFEEDLFQKIDYADQEAHSKEHSNFVAYVGGLDLTAVDEDQVTHGKKILNFLITWLFKHISGTDYLYRDLMIAKGIQ